MSSQPFTTCVGASTRRLSLLKLRYLFDSDAEGSPHPLSPYRGTYVDRRDAAGP
jgi:hypothetical protein